MKREYLINKTVMTLSRLPLDKVKEISDFVDLICKKQEEDILQKGIEKLVSDSVTFDFLKEDEDLYSLDDLKVKY